MNKSKSRIALAFALTVQATVLMAAPAGLESFGYNNMRVGTGLAPRGARPLLVVLIDFSYNAPLAITKAQADSLIFPISGRTLNRYFLDASNNRFYWSRAGAGVIGPVAVTMRKSQQLTNYRMDDPKGISYVLKLAFAQNKLDWRQFDTNGDGKLYADELGIMVVHDGAGVGARAIDPSGCLTPQDSGVQICNDGLNSYRRVSSVDTSLVTMCHELTHQLGATDMYGKWGTTACWNNGLTIMSCSGPTGFNLDPWHKLQLGWSEPRIRSLTTPSSEALQAFQAMNPAAPVILYDPGRGTREFFILEYRTRSSPYGGGADADLPSQGLAIWHVTGAGPVVNIGAPFLTGGGNTLWGSGTMTLPLHWFNGARTGVRLFVGQFYDGAGTLWVSWNRQPSGIYYRNPLAGSGFAQAPGALVQVSVDSGDNVWGINDQDEIFKFNWSTKKFVQVPGSLTQIVAAGGTAWGINATQNIFRYNSTTRRFVGVPGKLVQIVAFGPNAAFGINKDFEIFRFNSSTQLFDQKLDGTLQQLAGVSEANLWGIDSLNNVFRYEKDGRMFLQRPGSGVIQIGADNWGGAWVINASSEVYRYNQNLDGFDRISGASLVQLSVGFDGAMWGFNLFNEIYMFENGGFKRVSGWLRQIATGYVTTWGLY